jgi:hypothetical protein
MDRVWVLNLAVHLAITVFTVLIRNHVVCDSCSATRKIYLTQVSCLLVLVFFLFHYSYFWGGCTAVKADGKFWITINCFYCRLSIVVCKTAKETLYSFQGFCEPDWKPDGIYRRPVTESTSTYQCGFKNIWNKKRACRYLSIDDAGRQGDSTHFQILNFNLK